MSEMLLAHMGHTMVLALPFGMVAGGLMFIFVAMRDGPKRSASNPFLPTNPLSRRVHAALKPPVGKTSSDGLDRTGGVRLGGPPAPGHVTPIRPPPRPREPRV